jgi:hypothetical protein
MEYDSVAQKVLRPVERRTLQEVIYGISNCKEARLVDFCGLRENASWSRSTSSCEVLGLPGAEHYQSLEIALTNVG